MDNDFMADVDPDGDEVPKVELVKREGSRPVTTTGIPHVQIGVNRVQDVHNELIRRVYSVTGIEDRPSVIGSWRGLWVAQDLNIAVPGAVIGSREFGHIHDDGSLHIFLEPTRSAEAVDTCWAIYHPFAVQKLEGWQGFVMLYTPQSIKELNVTFQLIVDAFNYVAGQNVLATDYYDE
jgi:phospholipase/carboxylesterase